jgi:hypothetical protein
MIRFIDLRNQGTYYRFAFWDTVVNRFIEIDNEQAWDSQSRLLEALQCDREREGWRDEYFERRRKRLTDLIPDDMKVDDGRGEEKWEAD